MAETKEKNADKDKDASQDKNAAQSQDKKDLKPVYLIFGDDFQVNEAIRRLRKRVGAGGDARLNVKEFDVVAGDQAADAVQAADMLPFLGETQLIILQRADKLNKDDQKTLAEYVAAPNATTVMVLTAGEKAAKASELYKAVDKIKGTAEYKAPRGAELVRWVEALFAEQGKKIDNRTARHFVDMVGTDQSALVQEVNKLAVFAGDRETVTMEDVDDVATRNPEANIFEMVDALGHKQTDKALTELNRLLFSGEAPHRVLAMVVRQFRIIIKAKALEGRRVSAGEAAAVLGVRPYLVDKYRQQARSFSMAELKEIYRLLKDADVAIKTGQREPGLAVEMLVGKIAG
ncbi:MAG: DNA polymerase III subunit delta [Actinomycetota bacterium]